MADSLRYDYVPKSIAERGALIKTLAPSLYTPTSFASLLTAKSPQNHNVRTFFDSLDCRVKTVFDLFEHGSYYDHPDDPISKIMLMNYPRPRELSQMKEPFVWVERAMDTHIPYGTIKHGNEVEDSSHGEGIIGKEYGCGLYSGKIDAAKEYVKGVLSVEKHFWAHVDELNNMGVLKRTLVIFTSDHGELLGEYGRFIHNYPPCKELVEVPTVFLDTKLNFEFMRSIDILPSALGILELKTSLGGCDGLDVREEKPRKGVNCTGSVLTVWEFRNGEINLIRYYRKRRDWRGNIWVPIPICIVRGNRKLIPVLKKSTSALLL